MGCFQIDSGIGNTHHNSHPNTQRLISDIRHYVTLSVTDNDSYKSSTQHTIDYLRCQKYDHMILYHDPAVNAIMNGVYSVHESIDEKPKFFLVMNAKKKRFNNSLKKVGSPTNVH